MEGYGYDAVLRHPTVMAERKDGLVAMLGTINSEKAEDPVLRTAVVVGPLVIDSKRVANGGPLAMRLMDVYDALLQHAGVKGAVFWVHKANTKWIQWLSRLGIGPYAEKGDYLWYVWRTGGWKVA